MFATRAEYRAGLPGNGAPFCREPHGLEATKRPRTVSVAQCACLAPAVPMSETEFSGVG